MRKIGFLLLILTAAVSVNAQPTRRLHDGLLLGVERHDVEGAPSLRLLVKFHGGDWNVDGHVGKKAV